MIKLIISDLSKVILFSKDDSYEGSMSGILKANQNNADYIFENLFKLNEEYLEFLNSQRQKLSLVLFTAGQMLAETNLKSKLLNYFDQLYDQESLGFIKDDVLSYQTICKNLNVETHEALFIDDNKGFVEVAKNAGLKAILYRDNKNLFKELSNFIN